MPSREHWTVTRDMKRYNFYLPRPLVTELDEFARDEGVSRSELIRRALNTYMNARKRSGT